MYIPFLLQGDPQDPPQTGVMKTTSKNKYKMSKKIQSVMGPISPDDLGVTFCHEHLSMDFEEAAFTAPASRDQHKPLCSFSIENLGWIRQVKAKGKCRSKRILLQQIVGNTLIF